MLLLIPRQLMNLLVVLSIVVAVDSRGEADSRSTGDTSLPDQVACIVKGWLAEQRLLTTSMRQAG